MYWYLYQGCEQLTIDGDDAVKRSPHTDSSCLIQTFCATYRCEQNNFQPPGNQGQLPPEKVDSIT